MTLQKVIIHTQFPLKYIGNLTQFYYNVHCIGLPNIFFGPEPSNFLLSFCCTFCLGSIRVHSHWRAFLLASMMKKIWITKPGLFALFLHIPPFFCFFSRPYVSPRSLENQQFPPSHPPRFCAVNRIILFFFNQIAGWFWFANDAKHPHHTPKVSFWNFTWCFRYSDHFSRLTPGKLASHGQFAPLRTHRVGFYGSCPSP